MTKSKFGKFLLYLGIFRSISVFKIFLHLPIYFFGVAYIILNRKVDRQLVPSIVLFFFIILSCAVNGLGAGAYAKALLILGAVGVADFVSRQDAQKMARTIAGKVLVICILFIVIETFLIALGLGARQRSLEALVATDTAVGGAELPRYMGFRGGSAYSALILGVLGLWCFAFRYKTSGLVYFALSLLMLSRGPLLAVFFLLAFLVLRYFKLGKFFAAASCIGVIFSPVIVAISVVLVPLEFQKYLIDVSTTRYFHWVSFLNFGIQNPIFGVGYDNFKDYYVEYSYTVDALEYGVFTENRLLEAHNLMLDIVGELGFVSATIWGIQMLMMLRLAIRDGSRYLPMLLYVCVCSAFLSALSDWAVWVCFGLIIGEAKIWRSQLTMERQTS